MATTPAPLICSHLQATGSPRQLPEDLLLEIFLRIGCRDDLTRASCACVAFRRLITDPAFLLRYHNHHQQLLLGIFPMASSMAGFQPVEAPHHNTAAVRALGNISFDYLPQDELRHWHTLDVRDGRILLECRRGDQGFRRFAVCDPLSRRYHKLPLIPHYDQEQDFKLRFAVFAPCANENEFRVIGQMHYKTKLVVSVFDSGSGSWSLGTSSSWKALFSMGRHELRPGRHSLFSMGQEPAPFRLVRRPHHAYGCIYWKATGENKLLKLDVNRMELSTVDLPPILNDGWHLLVVEAEKRGLGMFSCTPDCKFMEYYCYNRMQNEWQMKNRISMPVHDYENLWILGATRGYIFLQVLGLQHTITCYKLDIYTLKLERVSQLMSSVYYFGHPYFGSRQSMSRRRI